MNISIKNVKEEDWRFIKSEAVKNNITIGEFLNKVILEYNDMEREAGNWNEIVYGKKFLKDTDTVKIRKVMKDFRKEFEFR